MRDHDIFFDLECFVDVKSQEFHQRFEALSEGQRSMARRLLHVFETCDDLTGPDVYKLLEALQTQGTEPAKESGADTPLAVALDESRCEMARRLIDEFSSIHERLVELAWYAKPGETSPRGQAFFAYVARTYGHGFAPECVVMCRAVIESELNAEISTDDCIQKLGSRRPPNFDLADRIAVAQKLGRLDYEAAQAAHQVREAGNRAVHRDPISIGLYDAKKCIDQSLQVLHSLDQTRPD